MFNSVNNPFGKRIEAAFSTTQDNKQHKQQQNEEEEEEKKFLEEDGSDEVKIGGKPILTEDDVVYMAQEYINKLKSAHSDNEKIVQKLDKYLSKFDAGKFMKRNPNLTSSDFYMVIYNETENLLR